MGFKKLVLNSYRWIASLMALSACGVLAEDPVSFRKDIAPVLQNKCVACHGPKKAEGGYRLDSFERALKEGDSGAPGFAAGQLEDSEAFRRIISDDADERMPLEADPLEAETIALFQRWLEEGAKFDGDNPAAELITIMPPPTHPASPEAYPFPVPVIAVAFSSDGTELFAGGYHELTVWNVETGELKRRIPNVGQRTYALALSPDGKRIAVGCGAPGRLGETRIYDAATGELQLVLGSTGDDVLDVAFSPAGDRLVTASADGSIRLYEVSSGAEQRVITSHSDWVSAVAWNADGSKLASASRDKTAKVFDAKTGELLVTYSGHGNAVHGVTFHPGGEEVYSSGSDKKIHRWKIADGKKSADIGFGGIVYEIPRIGEFLFATSADKTVRQFEAATHKQVRSLPGHTDWALSVDYHAPSKRIASGGFDGRILIWNAEDGKQIASYVAAPGWKP